MDKIRAIRGKGLQVKHLIHRHALSESEAFEVEVSLIDFIRLNELTNKVSGKQSTLRLEAHIKKHASDGDLMVLFLKNYNITLVEA